jgi:thiamine-monophosphate kinase
MNTGTPRSSGAASAAAAATASAAMGAGPGGAPRAVGEFDLIQRYFAQMGASRSDVVLGVGDDAALIKAAPDRELVVTVDAIVAGRHFPEDTDPRSIGHRALAVNLSDLAAMGADPAWATLALTLPQADPAWLDGFAAGFAGLALAHGVALVGGDTTAGPLTVSVQLIGQVPVGAALRRDGARPGDLLVVSGTLGDAGAGLAIAQGRLETHEEAAAGELRRRFDYPTPRVAFGLGARGLASAAMDLSDGLAGDLPKLCAASGVAMHIDVESLPLSAALSRVTSLEQARDWAMGAGDDYELLLAVPPQRYDALAEVARRLNLRSTIVGRCDVGNSVTWALNGRPIVPSVSGYDHFR